MRIPIPYKRAQRLLSPSNFSFNFGLTIHFAGRIDPHAVEIALAKVCRLHPILGSRVELEGDDKGILTNDETPTPSLIVVPRYTDDSWLAHFQQFLAQQFDYRRGPLVHSVLVQGDDASELILILDHSTADGRAGQLAARGLVRFMAEPALERSPIVPLGLREAVTDEVERLVVQREAEAVKSGPDKPWSPNFADTPQLITPFSLSANETATLVQRCRSEGVTVQAALCAAFLQPFADRDPDHPQRVAEVPVDLRPFLRPPAADWYANYLSLVLITADCSGNDLWETARRAAAQLKSITPDELFFSIPAVWNLSEKLAPQNAIDTPYDISISNLGRWDAAEVPGKWKVISVHAPTFNVVSKNHYVWGLNTCNGVLTATFTSCESNSVALGRESWQKLKSMVE